MSSKDLMDYLRTQGHQISNHMCSIEDSVAQILRDRLPRPTARAGKTKDDANGSPSSVAAAKTGKTGTSSKDGDRKPKTAKPKTGAPPKPGSRARPERGRTTRPGESPTADDRKAKPAPKATRKRFFPGAEDYSYDSGGKRIGRSRSRRGQAAVARPPSTAEVELPTTVKELASTIGVRVPDIIRTMMPGKMLTMNSAVDEECLEALGEKFSIKITIQQAEELEDSVREIDEYQSDPEKLKRRAPVVTFLGHVDHGKTSLLDYIRKSKVTDSEHGGITQHIGAYKVDDGEVEVVFIDTPGHKAFTEMRARGANVTDLAVLIVAADEGPMPQTEEAYSHAKAAEVPIVVALNKIDRPNANPQAAMDKLSRMGLMPVKWGGDTEIVEVSAITGDGVDNLLETLALEAEILDLKADPERLGLGVVLEAESDAGRGNLAMVLVQDGTLRPGDHVLCGASQGRVRKLWLNGNTEVKEAGPATPVQVTGLNPLPEVGEKFYVINDATKVKAIAEERQIRRNKAGRATATKVTLQNLWEQFDKAEVKEVRIILKADVQGTLEALEQQLDGVGNEEVMVKVIHTGVGTISQDDILLADASGAIVFGFNVGADDRGRLQAEERKVELRLYNVIYELLDEVTLAIESRLAPTLREQVQGQIEILQVFNASKIGNIAGCMVRKGSVFRDSQVRLIRGGEVILTSKLSSLKRFKDDVKEVKEGFECGIKIAQHDDIQPGDIVEAYTIVEEKRTLAPN
jgi:translation initiation factor IF-2